MRDARWDEVEQRWIVQTSGATYAARTVISCAGALSEPRLPDIDGIGSFEGEIFHSARWDHDIDLTGKRIAVIGTGASAIQIVPELQQIAGRLDVYQRTAPWVIPRNDRTYSKVERLALEHVPGLQSLYRTAIYWGRETFVPAFTWQPKLAKPAEMMARSNIRKGITDPALREKVTPDFQIGCKRILISNTYYPALDADNTELVTDGIQKVTPRGIVTADGTEREIDVLVVATGFHVTDMPIAEHITGRDGRALSQVWAQSGQSAYKGTTVSGFPNLFFLVGPNTGLGHSSMVFMIESQVTYVRQAVRAMRRNAYAVLDVLPEAERAWSEDMQRRMQPTVWASGGCSSWYLDEFGNNTTLWPRSTFAFRGALASFDIDKYRVEATRPAAAPTGGVRS